MHLRKSPILIKSWEEEAVDQYVFQGLSSSNGDNFVKKLCIVFHLFDNCCPTNERHYCRRRWKPQLNKPEVAAIHFQVTWPIQ